MRGESRGVFHRARIGLPGEALEQVNQADEHAHGEETDKRNYYCYEVILLGPINGVVSVPISLHSG